MSVLSEHRRNVESVLAERARLLARPIVEVDNLPAVALITFSTGSERYAIDVAFVHRLERCTRVTPLPGAARYFAGITNFHGQLVPLIDLGLFLGAAPALSATFVIVLGTLRAEIGIVADALLEMRAAPRDDRKQYITADGIAVIDAAALIANTMNEENG